MPTIPKELPKAICWVRRRVLVWGQPGVPGQIGLQEQQVAELADLAQQANAALAEYRTTETLMRAQGARYRHLAHTMRAKANAQVSQIQSFARGADEPQEVYYQAKLRRPAKRGPAPAPGQPQRFKTRLTEVGGLEITFKCPHPRGVEGVLYRIERQDDCVGPMRYLDTVNERRFVDENIPVGVGSVFYQVTAMTSTRKGPVATHSVRLGTVREEAPAQRAA